MKKTRSLVPGATVALGALLFGMFVASMPAHAQPVPDGKGSGSGAAGSGSDTGPDGPLYPCKNAKGLVSVTFKPETELKDLVTWAEGFTCKNFIFDPRIVATGKKVTVISPNKMTAGEAYRVFLVSLSTMGLTVVPKGNMLRIVESATAKSETVPIYRKGIPGDEDQVVRYVLRPSYAQVETLRQALDAIRSPAGNVTAVGTMLVITDYASQVRDMMTLAHAIDVPGGSDGIYTIPVMHADATQLATKLNEILGITATSATAPGAPTGGRRGPETGKSGVPGPATQAGEDVSAAIPSKIVVDERSNTLVVVSGEAGYLRVKALVDRLDISLDTEAGASIHVYTLENALAEELATTLNNAMNNASQANAQRNGQSRGPGQGGPPAPAPPPPISSPGAPGAENMGASLEGTVRIIGDKPTNSLIVMSTGRDFIAIKDVIRRLDLPRRQVYIEAMILEVQMGDTLQLGTSSHGGLPFDNSNALVIGGVQTSDLRSIAAASTLASATGLIGGLIGAPLANSQTFLGTSIPSFGVLVQALASQANTDILSNPHIICIDNEKTEFSDGTNIPYKAGLSFGGLPTASATGSTAAASPVGSIGQNIQREDLNLSLNITPHISSNDAVRLEIEQETKDIGDKDPDLGPSWTQRKLKTQVVVKDQQTVVIGGLIQERDIYNVTKVPLLGDIPIVGYLFKYTTHQKKKTNLLIMLTPYIIKDQLDLQAIRERKVRERDEYVKSFSSLNDMKYQPTVDYRRKRGLVEEINRAVESVEDDIATMNALGKRRYVDPGPIEYGPSSIEAPGEPPPAPRTPAPAPAPGDH
ncbi:MAG TPA: type II secretion system secretin GspD [Kofleriaceae bacterium]